MMESDKLTERLASLSPAKRALLELKLQQGRAGIGGNMTIPRRANKDSAPLSFAQQRLWFLDQLEPDSCAYNEGSALRLDGPLNIDALRGALNAIVERHEVLRTTYGMTDGGEPVQRIGAAMDIDLPVIDSSEVTENRRDDEVRRIAAKLRERPFDLSKDMPLRLALIRLSPSSHVLVEVQHHIASDGWSSGVFLRELTALYTSMTQRLTSPLSELPIQYVDYAVWQREWLQGEVLEKQVDYWAAQLQNLPVLELPTDRPRGALSSNCGARQTFTLSKALFDELRLLGNQEGATLFMTLLAAFQILLHRYTGQDDVVVGSPIAGRTRPETEGLIGFFVNMMVLRTKLSGNLTFRELLARVRETALQAYEHQDLPFEKLVEELNPGRHQSQTPLFQVVFAMQNVPRSNLAIPGLIVAPFEIDSSTAKFDIFAAFIEREREMMLRIEYRAELFEATTIERMFDHFQRLLEGIVAEPDQKISDFLILTAAERHQLLVEWNDTKRNYPSDKCIHQLFEEQVERSPDSIALVFEGRRVSYRELNSKANQLAHHLKQFGVGANVLVGICMERSVEMIIGLLGILKAGGAYVPLDPSYPKERLAFMLQDSGAPVLITQQAFVDVFINHTAKIISLDTDWEKVGQGSESNLAAKTSPDSLAYVIYTSGSTGQPKGVAVSHQAVNRLVINTDYVQVTPPEVMAQASNVSFDAATFEIWGALLNGARLVLIAKDTLLSPQSLSTAIERHGITTLFLTTALFNQMVEQIPAALGKLRHLLFGGEAVDPQRVKELLHKGPPKRLVHVYGPTETTTFASWYCVKDVAMNATTVPIGRPIANTEIYVLDAHIHPVPIGVAGELHIGGDGLARGYLNRPELTAEKFIKHPFSNDPQARLYKTGDRVRYLADGNIEFLGRIDNQVKIRGFRIEPGEIEAVLNQHSGIRECVVMARQDDGREKCLVAYVVADKDSRLASHDLRAFLKHRLPEYMVPAAFVFLATLPLTPNGKLDRRALPAPDLERREVHTGYVPPRTEVESVLAEIWAEVLKVERVGIHDNFFDLGGHSLMGNRLIAQVCKELQIELPLRRLFECPTVAALAVRLSSDLSRAAADRRANSSWSYLFELKPGTGNQPVFFLPGGFGGDDEFLVYARLIHFVGDNYMFYGLRARSADGTELAHPNVEEMAADYLQEIRALHPEGPYFLIGNCIGGIVAYEIARQLEASGQKVALLVLMDTWPPSLRSYLRYRAKLFKYIARTRHHFARMRELARNEQVGYLISKTRVAVDKLRNFFSSLVTTQFETGSDHVREGYVDTLLRYRPRPYPGRVVMLNNETSGRDDLTLGWKDFVRGGIAVHTIPGDHDAYIRQYVRVAGEKLRECLDKASSENSLPRSQTENTGDAGFEPKNVARLGT